MPMTRVPEFRARDHSGCTESLAGKDRVLAGPGSYVITADTPSPQSTPSCDMI
jgi:hypothetical protein